MRFTIIIIFTSFIVFNSNSQNRLSLQICNAQKAVLSFVNVYNISNKTGCISNSKGICQIKYRSINDTILFSYIGYKRKKICLKDIISDTIIIEKKVYSIKSVDIIGVRDENYLAKLLNEVIRVNKKRNYEINAQANLIAESYIDSIPLERIEGVGNIIGGMNSKLSFDIVMGRFGQNNKFNFYNLALNSLLERITLFNSNKKLVFPQKITDISKRKIKKTFKLSLVKYDSVFHTICFIADDKYSFSGEIIFNKNNKLISYIRLFVDNPLYVGLNPIFDTDTLHTKYFEYRIEFSKFSYKLSYINIIHNYDYSKEGDKFLLTTNIVVFPVKYEEIFPKSISNLEMYIPTIYDHIIITPNNTNFWNDHFFTNNFKNSITFDFFKDYGYITNYDVYAKDSLFSFFNQKIRPWNANTRINYSDFAHNSNDFGINENLVNSNNMKYLPSELYNFKITYDLFFFDTVYIVKTFIDLNNSYYFLEKSYQNLVAINIYFDIFEKNRIELQKQLNIISDINKAKVIANRYFIKSKKEATLFFINSKKGQNTDTLVYWNNIINKQLEINNIDSLIKKSYKKVASIIDYYNIGTALLAIGNYAESVQFLSDDIYILNHSKMDADVYNERMINTLVNRAIAYIELKEFDKACNDLYAALDLGDEKAMYYINKYCN